MTTPQIIPIESREQWLTERAKDVTSTEVAALYGLSPYMSEFELFHHKREGTIVSIEPNERMRWGTRLEAAIAEGAAEDQGWDIGKLNVYMRDIDARMGSSFDFEIKSSSDGPGILEIKNVDRLQYAKTWIDDGEGNIEAPEHIELQVQHQMEISGYAWCAIVALVGGNEQKVVYRNRDKDIGKDIRRRIDEFWARIAANNAPAADYTQDAEFIIKQLRGTADEDLVAHADKELEDLIKQYEFVRKEGSDIEKIKEQYKAQILNKIGTASKVLTSFGTLSCNMVKGSQGKLVTQDMVGTYVGARSGYRGFRFNEKKEKSNG
ncbi:exonuclease [Caudoviricetes sp.]|nr:exonuclease [Caudoviricetes sp.]